jgi:acyl transferase domain-containing protein
MSAELSLAAINAPQRCVVSGPGEAIAALQRRLEKQELPCQRLHTSHAFHSEMMEPVLEPFRRFLRDVELHEPKIPYISNVTGDWITAEQATSPDYWADHLRRTVHFADGVVQLLKEPDCVLLEVGPGQTLTNLARQSVNGSKQEAIIASGDKLEDDLLSLINAAAKLWLAGAELDWSGFYAHERRQRLPLPTYPFERKSYWIERPVADQRLAPHVPDSAFEIVSTQLHVMDLQLKAFRESA